MFCPRAEKNAASSNLTYFKFLIFYGYMSQLKLINNTSEMSLDSRWAASAKFNSKNRVCDEFGRIVNSYYTGRTYRIVDKRERYFSFLERFVRACVGCFAVFCSLGISLSSENVRKLFTQSKENKRFAILLPRRAEVENVRRAEQERARQGIIEEYSPAIVEALGGPDNVLNFPVCHYSFPVCHYSNSFITHPIRRFRDFGGNVGLVFLYYMRDELGRFSLVEEWLLKKMNRIWVSYWSGDGPSFLCTGFMGFSSNALEAQEQQLADKLRRLVARESISLVGEAMQRESRVSRGSTDVFLANPSFSERENMQMLREHFPNAI